MKRKQDRLTVRASVVAVRVALIAMAAAPVAYAADPAPAADAAVVELTQPTNFVEAGAGYVSQASPTFGKYNGLFNKGAYGIFNFDVRSEVPYDSESATRWRLTGTNLGLDTRNATAEYGEQGTYRVFLGFDELRSNYTNFYQTPFQGWGSNTLTLPSNWLKPIVPQVSTTAGNFRVLSPTTGPATALTNGVLTPPTPAQLNQIGQIQAADLPDFNNIELDTVRKTYLGGFSVNFGPRWSLLASASQTDQNGLKPLNMINLASGTVSSVMPNLIDQTTNQYNVGLTYTGDQFFMTAAYYGSYYTNHVSGMTFDNAFLPGTSATMSSAPSNEFNQFTLKSGYNFTKSTKLVMGASYGRNTQNDQFLVSDASATPLELPTSSLNGLVETTAFNAKLTSKPIKDWSFGLGYKYYDRDNKTPINTYEFYDAGEAKTGASSFNAALGQAPGTLGSNINIYSNRPYSKKVNQFNAEAGWQYLPTQSLKGEYEYQQIDRSCPGSWINCADAPKTTQNTLKAAWDGNLAETLSGRLSYSYSQRNVDYDENAWLALVPMANVVPGAPTVGATSSVVDFLHQTGLGGFGPIAPYVALQPGNLGIFFPNNSALPQALYGSRNDIHEIPGMRRFNMADRNQSKVRASIDWGATEQLSLQGNVEYNDDDYRNSIYGLQSAKGLAASIDANWVVNENFSANAWYTYQQQKAVSAGASYSAGAITNTANVGGVAGNTVVQGGCFDTVADKNANAKIDPCLNWSANTKDTINSFGAGFKWTGLMSGKLELDGDLVYTDAKTAIGMTGGTYANNPYAVAGQPAVTPAVFFIPATDLPDVTSKTIELRIVGTYALDKASALRLFYWYQHQKTTDFAYDGTQTGTLSGVMPTNEQASNYNVNVVGLSYIYRWQ